MKTYRATFKKEGMKQKSLFIHVGREGTPEVSKLRKIEAKNNLETINALIYN